jgi:hypothetical protein
MPTNSKPTKRDTAERGVHRKQSAPERLPGSPNRKPERDRSRREYERRIERFRER